jgi:hypothetical protein
MLPQALSAPTRSHDAAGTILIGGVLLLLSLAFPLVLVFALAVSPIWLVLTPLAVFPPLLTLGYDLRVIEAGLRESAATPPFLGWSRLARDGFRSILLGVVCLVPAMVVVVAAGLIVAGVQMGQIELTERTATAVTGVTTAGAGAFLLLYLVVFLYVRPATLAVFVATGRMRAALSPRRVFRVALSTDYAIGWTTAAAVLTIGWAIAAPLQLLVVGFFLAFYVRAVASYAYGRGARTRLAELEDASLGAETFARQASPASRADRPSSGAGAELTADTEPTPATGAGRSTADRTSAADRSVAPSWSPRIEPEAPAAVQVGRDVPVSGGQPSGADDESAGETASTWPTDGSFEWDATEE